MFEIENWRLKTANYELTPWQQHPPTTRQPAGIELCFQLAIIAQSAPNRDDIQ
jgi:hypothetical protein